MTKIINELLATAESEASHVKLQFVKLDFASLVQRVVDINLVLASQKNQKIHFNILNTPSINGDEIKLTEIVDNLLNNAIKYSSRNKNITLTIKQENNQAILEVADEGLGFTEEDKENLFQRFTRLSSKPTGGETSTGLGLSIVKTLVEAHHGKISAESDGKDKGSNFIVEIPVAQ